MKSDTSQIQQGKDLFSHSYYSTQCQQTFKTLDQAWDHYLENGEPSDFEPAQHFLTRWYRWQNPDSKGYPCILDHFVEKGRDRLIDPSPFVDLKRIAELTAAENSIDAYRNVLQMSLASHDGYFANYAELQKNQVSFFENISVDLVKKPAVASSESPRKRLVWVQIGPNSEFIKWFDRSAPRSWDLLCNWYNFDAVDLSLGDLGFAQRGTKFTGVVKVMEQFGELLEGYDQVLFLDDDLQFEFGEIDRLFNIAQSENLSLFQPALTEDSFCIWPDIKMKTTKSWLPFNTVEIMMPGMSMSFLKTASEIWKHSVSGFGIDLAMGKLATAKNLKAGVIFDVRAKHFKPIDDSSGAYYEYMRKNGINPKLELWKLICDYDCELEIKALHTQ